jgi:stearoyl-CoA desaturase (delta-9 desaturase)
LDPHTTKNGFFFSHIGWLLVKKSNKLIEEGKKIDMSDLDKDSVVMF